MKRAVVATTTGLGLLHAAPALSARGPLRRVLPRLYGVGRPGGVALTFDDGPDPQGTPAVLAALDELGWRATFFVLGAQVRAHPRLARQLVEQGHELAVHGDAHRNQLGRSPAALHRDLRRARDSISNVVGAQPVWFRPPYGVLSGGGVVAARALGLLPVLWTAWGQDWRRTDGPRIADTVCRDLDDRGTVLLHDSDITSNPGSWRATVDSLPLLAQRIAARGWEVRTLAQHLAVP